jgi:hypothetical protein
MKTQRSEPTRETGLPVSVLTQDLAPDPVLPTSLETPMGAAPPAGEPRPADSAPARAAARPEPGEHPVTLDDQIALRAYYLYLDRQGGDGDALSDWLEAERQVSQEQSILG